MKGEKGKRKSAQTSDQQREFCLRSGRLPFVSLFIFWAPSRHEPLSSPFVTYASSVFTPALGRARCLSQPRDPRHLPGSPSPHWLQPPPRAPKRCRPFQNFWLHSWVILDPSRGLFVPLAFGPVHVAAFKVRL